MLKWVFTMSEKSNLRSILMDFFFEKADEDDLRDALSGREKKSEEIKSEEKNISVKKETIPSTEKASEKVLENKVLEDVPKKSEILINLKEEKKKPEPDSIFIKYEKQGIISPIFGDINKPLTVMKPKKDKAEKPRKVLSPFFGFQTEDEIRNRVLASEQNSLSVNKA